MDGDFMKFVITAIGSGGLVAALLKVIGPALKLNQAGTDSSARAIAAWEKLFNEQKAETAAAMKLLDESRNDEAKAESRAQKAERKAAELELRLQQYGERIRLLKGETS